MFQNVSLCTAYLLYQNSSFSFPSGSLQATANDDQRGLPALRHISGDRQYLHFKVRIWRHLGSNAHIFKGVLYTLTNLNAHPAEQLLESNTEIQL